ncbi:GspE/PulE family protein [Patescibacteria group bacterium]|nr:GspE/PulE family protein [Patescibacteria group bacterium]MDE1946687.1 type II/IV secretion system protein [Patescibacteria group bacterium]MDE2010640.1 type II/IV secretion system protein [Patescibacteria group bacterium]MDE2233312.1 type II/IV secretion system protein [Patescibacteria group bacterium]
MLVEDTQLYKFILDSGLVSKAELEEAKEETEKKGNKRLGDILVKQGKITADNLRRMEAYTLGIPFVDLKGKKIPFDTLSLIPEPIARSHNIVAFKKSEVSLEVAMLDVNDLSAIDFIKKKVRLKILPRLTDSDSIKEVLVQYQKSLKAEFGDIIQKETETLQMISEGKGEPVTEEDWKKIAEDLPVVRIVDTLIKHAVIQNASDIHIEPMEEQVLVRYRIDGLLHDAMVLPKQAGPSITARIKVLSNLKLDEKRLPQDGRFKVDMNGEKVSFRVSILPTYYGEKTVMRLLRESISGFTLEYLHFHGEGLERIHKALKQATGMILTTGPTGSGKTTTLYTMLDILNQPDVNISTIEDPIEYQMARINQTQVKPEIGFSFAQGIRTLVRQDPDIIMVGEIRDNETASLAVNAALTGHLVLSTLHTNSAAGAVPRLMDMKVEPFLLVSTINIIIGQRLVRRLTDAKEQYFLSKAEFAQLEKIVSLDRVLAALKAEKVVKPNGSWDKIPFYKAVPSGDDDGFKTRVGIHEVMEVTQSIKDLIMKNATAGEIEEQAKKEGMLTMLEDGIFKCAAGMTTIEEVLRVVTE